jgi:hypothetical protein
MDLGYADAPRLFAIDYSTSVTGNWFYYQEVSAIVKDNIRGNDVILLWDHGYRQITTEELEEVISSQSGGGGTAPIAIAEAISFLGKSKKWHLILITDGQVGVTSIDQCDSFVNDHDLRFDFVTGFMIGEEGNLSVLCPFTRGCSHIVHAISLNGSTISRNEIAWVNDDDLALLSKIGEMTKVEEFERSFESLRRSLIARTLGTIGDRRLRNEMIDLQNRLARNLGGGIENVGVPFRKALESKRLMEALEYGSQLVQTHVVPAGLSSKLHELIRMCEGSLRLTFDAGSIQSARAERARSAIESDALDAIPIDSTAGSFVCPISYDDETDPAILVAQPTQPFLFRVGPKTVTQMLDCPLNALLKRHFLDDFASILDHALSLNSMRQAAGSGSPITTSPITRRKLSGAIPLGAAKSHAEAADWTLSRILSGGKVLGNADLWFAVFWMMIENGRAPHLADLLPFIREQMIWRLRFRYSSASVTGLSGFVQRRIPLGCAIWFCLASPAFSIRPTIAFDPLRLHLMHINMMRCLLELIGYELPDGVIRHAQRLRGLFALLSFCKWNNTDFQALIRGLQQRWIYVDRRKVKRTLFGTEDQIPMYVPIDGAPTIRQLEVIHENLPRRCLSLTMEELIGLANLVNPNLSAGAIELPLDWQPKQIREPVVEWSIYDGVIERFSGIEICPSTMRPFAQLSNGENWRECLTSTIGIELDNDRIFSGHRWYGRFVCTTRQYPNPEELVEFIFNRIVLHGERAALMQDIKNFADLICHQYASVIVGVPPGVFIWRFTKSGAIDARMRMEREPPENKTIKETGLRRKDRKPPKGQKKQNKKKHTEANQKYRLTGTKVSEKAKMKVKVESQA